MLYTSTALGGTSLLGIRGSKLYFCTNASAIVLLSIYVVPGSDAMWRKMVLFEHCCLLNFLF